MYADVLPTGRGCITNVKGQRYKKISIRKNIMKHDNPDKQNNIKLRLDVCCMSLYFVFVSLAV